jgi:hypothetical protein
MTSAFDYEQISDYCWNWLCKKYNCSFQKPEYKIIGSCKKSKYKTFERLCEISIRRFWHTYKRKHIGVYAKRINCEPIEDLHTNFIHEMTHYIQHAKNNFDCELTCFSEIETTENEINFVKEHYPHLYKKLKKI